MMTTFRSNLKLVSKNSDLFELPTSTHRRTILQLLLMMTVVFGLSFSALNWQSNMALAAAELVLVFYALCLLPLVHNEQWQWRISLLFLLPHYSIFLYGLASPESPSTVFIWTFVVPMVTHLLLRRWYGLWISIIFMSVAMVLFIARFHEKEGGFDTLAIYNVGLTGLAVLVFCHIYEVSRTRVHRKLFRLATTDSLTSLANRTRFLDVFERERNHAERNGSDLSLLLLDLDHFKQVNDCYGHNVGDEVLKHVATALTQRLRKTDLACRLGGEEFAILLPGASLDRAIAIAESIRKNIVDVPYINDDKRVSLSISIGAAEYGSDGVNFVNLYAVADSYLYHAKSEGRNQVCYRRIMHNHELDLALAEECEC